MLVNATLRYIMQKLLGCIHTQFVSSVNTRAEHNNVDRKHKNMYCFERSTETVLLKLGQWWVHRWQNISEINTPISDDLGCHRPISVIWKHLGSLSRLLPIWQNFASYGTSDCTLYVYYLLCVFIVLLLSVVAVSSVSASLCHLNCNCVRDFLNMFL